MSLILSNLKLISTSQAPPSGTGLEFITSNTVNDVTSMTIPATAQVGDLAVLFSYCRGLAATGGDTPAGWTEITDVTQGTSSTGIRALAAYKILASGEPGSSITGLTFGGQEEAHHMRIYRPYGDDYGVVEVSTPSAQGTSATPTDQTIGVLSTITGYVAFAVYSSSASITTRGFTPAANTEDSLTGGEFYVKSLLYLATDSPESITVSMSDGGENILQSFAIRFPSSLE